MVVRLADIEEIYEQEVKKNTKNKEKVYRFERNKMTNLLKICDLLRNDDCGNIHYNIFMIKYPKYRIVMSLDVLDKVINHYITRFVLMPRLERYLDERNVATRKGLGRDYALKQIKKYMEKMKKYGTFYILKMDISKYFYQIDHHVLKEMLKRELPPNEFHMMEMIIDSTNLPYINEKISHLKEQELKKATVRRDEVEKVPFYETGKGLPIGNMTSQFLSIYYLNGLDHKIVHDFHLKYYIRYMDDFVIFSHDKDYLKEVYQKIAKILNDVYCLKVNCKKTKITNCKEGFTFCGYRFRVIEGKTIVQACASSRKRVKKRLKEVRNLFSTNRLSLSSVFSSVCTYEYGFKFGTKRKMQRMVETIFFRQKG